MHSTDAIVLKKIDTGEADAFFVCYTRDFGKIKALAQGVKKENAKLKGHLEMFNLATISFVLGRQGERLTHACASEVWPAIRGDLGRLTVCQEIAALTDEACLIGEKDACVWRLLLESFWTLEKSAYTIEVARRFRRRLGQCLGTAQGGGSKV